VIPYLQAAALGPRVRAALSHRVDVDDLRALTAARAGVEAPPIAKLRRVSPRTVVQMGLLAAAAYLIITAVSGVDLAEIVDALKTASIPIMILALVVGQLPRLSQAESTRGACPRPMAYGPVALLQFAMTFIGLVVPSNVARVALNVRFFQKQGFSPATALSVGLVDTVAGVFMQALILISIMLFGLGDVNFSWRQEEQAGTSTLVWILVGVAAAVVVAALLAVSLPRVRRRVVDRIRPWMHDAKETLANLRTPSKVARILGANLATEILFASTLGLVVLSFGTHLSLADVLVINCTVSLFAGMMPVPGGIGVYEAGFIVGLTAAGVDQSTAFAAAICFRAITFYLPPLWGWFAFHHLERRGFI